MSIDKEAEKVIWSLQNNKRSKGKKELFTPTGKTPRKNNWKYITVVLLGLFSLSALLYTFLDKTVKICWNSTYCFTSENNPVQYIFYIFINVVVITFGIYFAYRIGNYLAKKLVP